MVRLNPARALPAHGAVIEDPIALIQRYVDHRAQREGQVLDALAAGHSSVESITAMIYPSLQDALIPMARESVLAHLHKLQTENRVVIDADAWSIVR
jgi:hydroxyacylglutathione hydrolase